MNNKENLKEYIEELRDEMNYWGVSSEAHDAIEHILRKMEKLTEK